MIDVVCVTKLLKLNLQITKKAPIKQTKFMKITVHHKRMVKKLFLINYMF